MTSFEVKLLQQLIEMMEEILHEVFINPMNSCDALNWELCLEIFVAYGVGLRMEWFYADTGRESLWWIGQVATMSSRSWYLGESRRSIHFP